MASGPGKGTVESHIGASFDDFARSPQDASMVAGSGRTDAVSAGIVFGEDGHDDLATGRASRKSRSRKQAHETSGIETNSEDSGTEGAKASEASRLQVGSYMRALAAEKTAEELDDSEEFSGTADAKHAFDAIAKLSARRSARDGLASENVEKRPHGVVKAARDTPSARKDAKGAEAIAEKIRQRRAWRASRTVAAASEASASAGAAASSAGAKGFLAAAASALAPIAGIVAGVVAFVLAALVVSQVMSALFGFWSDAANRDTGQLTGVEQEIAAELKEYGFTNEAIAGILGNLACESGMNPASDEVMDGKFNYAYERACGIFQYTSTSPGTGEYWNFKRWCTAAGKQWSSVKAQMEWTFSGKHAGTWSGRWSTALDRSGYYTNCAGYPGKRAYSAAQYKNADDVALAAYSWMACYERPANGNWAHLDRRISEAKRYYALLTAGGSGGSYAGLNVIVKAAYSQLGVPYVWGGSTPGVGLDCSGLTQYCYAQAGVRIAHYTETQYAQLQKVPLSQARPGDILYKPGHVAIYIGGDEYIHEPHTGDVCRKAKGIGYFTCALRAK